MSHCERKDQRIQNRRSPPPRLPDEDATEDSMDIGELFWKLAQVQMGAFAGLLVGFFLGATPGILGLVVGYGNLSGLEAAYWGAILGMVTGAILFGVIVWQDPH